MFKIITRALLALFILFFSSIWIIQNYTSIPETITHSIVTVLQKEWKATFDIKKSKLNLFTCSLHFYDGSVTPTNQKKYAWSFKHAKIYISPIKMLLGDPYSMYLTFNDTVAKTNYENNKSDLAEHIIDMFSPRLANMNVFPRSIIINNLDLTVEQGDQKIKAHLVGRIKTNYDINRHAPYLKKHWFGAITLSDGNITLNNIELAANLNSLISFYQNNDENQLYISHRADFTSKQLDHENHYTLEGESNPSSKHVRLTDSDNTLDLTAKLLESQEIALAGHFPLNLLNSKIAGTCNLNTTLTHDNLIIKSKGIVKLLDLNATGLSLQNITLTLINEKSLTISPDVETNIESGINCAGALSWDVSQAQGSLILANTSPLATLFKQKKPTASLFLIDPGALLLHISCKSNGNIKGSYKCCVTKQSSEKQYEHQGSFTYKNKKLCVGGKSNEGTYSVTAHTNPHPYITQWLYKEKNKAQVNLVAHKEKKTLLEGTVDWSLVESLLNNHLHRLLSGNRGTFAVSFDQCNLDHLKATIHLCDGQLYVPGNYNLVKNIQTNIVLEPSKKKLSISDASIALSKGSITCSKASCTLTNNYEFDTITFPIEMNNVFVNYNRDFYGIFDGKLLFNKKSQSRPHLTGSLMLKKSLMKDNLFKSSRNSMYNPLESAIPVTRFPIGLDVSLKTKHPIKARSDDFQTEATVDLAVKCKPEEEFGQRPYMVGTINLESGSIKLLNQKLDITQGRIQFLASKLNNPLIDVVAQNRINKYQVYLQASGSLLRPTILLESTPELSEEQIIGLLCSGSENTTLKSTVSTIILDQLKELITKNKNKKSNELFEKLSKPFQYVQITPTIDLASGKVEGLKGSISVNVNDQIRAEIQKNLSLDDKFSAQLEYLISDDINIKVVKDHHGELGSELEVRLKL